MFGLWADPGAGCSRCWRCGSRWRWCSTASRRSTSGSRRCSLPCSRARKDRRQSPAASSRPPPTPSLAGDPQLPPLSAGRRRRRRRRRCWRAISPPAAASATDASASRATALAAYARRSGPDRECLPQGILGPAAAGLDRPVRRHAAVRAGRRMVERLSRQLLVRVGRGVVDLLAALPRSAVAGDGSAARRRWRSRRSRCFTAGLQGRLRRSLPLRRRARRPFDADRVRRARDAGRAGLRSVARSREARACGRSPSC